MKKKKSSRWPVMVVLLVVTAVFVFRPEEISAPEDEYFSSINATLKERGITRPAVFIDLDRVDQNLAAITAHIQAPRQYRIVDKSLPSVELIRYVMEKTGSKRIMSFHEPFLSILFPQLGPDVDYLLGKPMPVGAAKEFYAGVPTASHADASARIQWLVDSSARLNEYLELAKALDQRLRVNIEIDVGLHRGGVKTAEQLAPLFKIVAENPKHLRFSGYMGYDGHLTHVPTVISSKESAVQDALEELVASYRTFVDYGKEKYPDWFTDATLNGAGSRTYKLYTAEHPLNDLAMGSCVVKPSAFDEFTLAEHIPAMFIAAPVLKKLDGFDVPFLDAVAPAAAWWNPNWRKTFYVYGGAWSENVVWPAGAQPNSLTTSPPNENMFPNQNMLNGSENLKLDVGDFVFYHPKQGDAMFQFEKIYVLRGGKIVDTWKPLPHRL